MKVAEHQELITFYKVSFFPSYFIVTPASVVPDLMNIIKRQLS